MQQISWLHLSDLHFREGQQQTWNENIVMEALLQDLGERKTADQWAPDFVVISGDIAYSGSEAEYRLAGKFLDQLLTVVGLDKSRLFLVPGNHDVCRRSISVLAASIRNSLNNRESIAEVLMRPRDRQTMMERLADYFTFLRDYLGGLLPCDDEHYFYTRKLDLAGLQVAVLGLNSSWLAGDDQDAGRLALGERQVHAALKESEGAALRIAALHHPFEWLNEADRRDCEGLLHNGCHVVLHGHLHRVGLTLMQSPDVDTFVLAAGAGYEDREHANSYNFVTLNVATGEGLVRLRAYSDEGGGFFHADNARYRNAGNGEWRFRLSKFAPQPSQQAGPGPGETVSDAIRAVTEALRDRRVLQPLTISRLSLQRLSNDIKSMQNHKATHDLLQAVERSFTLLWPIPDIYDASDPQREYKLTQFSWQWETDVAHKATRCESEPWWQELEQAREALVETSESSNQTATRQGRLALKTIKRVVGKRLVVADGKLCEVVEKLQLNVLCDALRQVREALDTLAPGTLSADEGAKFDRAVDELDRLGLELTGLATRHHRLQDIDISLREVVTQIGANQSARLDEQALDELRFRIQELALDPKELDFPIKAISARAVRLPQLHEKVRDALNTNDRANIERCVLKYSQDLVGVFVLADKALLKCCDELSHIGDALPAMLKEMPE